jgi:hypothetical protein
LTRHDVEYALSQLASDRVLPEKLPSKTKLFQALLGADKPLGRSDLLERVEVSASTYDRHIKDVREEFRALGLLKVVSVSGHKRMVATLAPYWARDGDGGLEDEFEEDVVEEIDAIVSEHAPGLSRRSRPTDVLFEVAAALDLELGGGVWGPESSVGDVYGLDSALSGWRPLLVGLLEHRLDEGPEGSGEAVATIGHVPELVSAQQMGLDEIVSIESESISL